MVFVLKSSPRERLGVIMGSQISSLVMGWLKKTFYWLKPMSVRSLLQRIPHIKSVTWLYQVASTGPTVCKHEGHH